MRISAVLSTDQWTQALAQMGAKAPIAVSRALNRTATNVRAAMAPVVARDIGVRVGLVRDAMRLVKATPQNLQADVEIRGARIPILELNARQTRTGVRYRSQGASVEIPHAFIATVGKGRHRGVFKRKSPARLPIVELRAVSFPHVFEKHMSVGIARAEEQLGKNLAHEFRFVVGQG